jgi:ADP-ribose pyrophosphatase
MLKRTDTANAICVVDDKLLVLHDEQPHLGSRQGFPGGRIDPEDLSPLTAAQREIREETGYSFQNWRLVKVWQPYRKMEWFIHVWLAWEVLNKIEPHVDAGEKIQVESLELAEVKQKVLQRVGYLGDYESIFKNIEKIDQLLALPQFSGREVDR